MDGGEKKPDAADEADKGKGTEEGRKSQKQDEAKKPKVKGPGTGPGNLKLWDLAGNGDCGFRVLAAQQALRWGTTKEDIEGKVQRLAGLLRKNVTEGMLKNMKDWEDSW